MTKYNQLANGDKEIYYKSVNTRWKQLYNLEYEQGKDILNNLFFINAGAIVTIISFMATIWSEGSCR